MTLHVLLCEPMNQLNHNWKLNLTSVQIRNKKGEAHNLSECTKQNSISLIVLILDKTYNIPVCLWIEESYPLTAPICYVRPTREMVVLRGKYISSNGEVLLPYLEEWKTVRIKTFIVWLDWRWRNMKCTAMLVWCDIFSGWMWPGKPPAGDGCHVWRHSSCMYAGASRARTSFL